MGRKEKPIEDSGPVGQFAQKLRDRRPLGSTYRSLAETTHYSHAVLAEACSGKRMPTWAVTEAFLKACGALESEIEDWLEEWDKARRGIARLLVKIGEASVVVPARSKAGLPVREGRLKPVQVDLAERSAYIPKPDAIQTFDDLTYQLQVLKIAVGNPSLGAVEKGLRDRGTYVSKSTLSEMMSGRRHPPFELFRSVVGWLLDQEDSDAGADTEAWLSVKPWLEGWRQAEFNRNRPDLTRRRRTGNVFLADDDEDAGPAASIIAEMSPSAAAELLTRLHKPIAASLLAELPPEKQRAVVNVMWQQRGEIDAKSAPTTADGTVLPYRPKTTQEESDEPPGGGVNAGA